MTTHAIIVPCLVSQGVRTWCFYDAGDELVSDDLVAITPEAVDCEACIKAMRVAHENLSKWVPRLGKSDERSFAGGWSVSKKNR